MTMADAKMAWDDAEDTIIYNAVLNHEEQYSIWPVIVRFRWAEKQWARAGISSVNRICLAWLV